MTEIFNTVWPYILTILPVLTSIFTVIGVVLKFVKDNKQIVAPLTKKIAELEAEVKNNKNYEEVKAQMSCLIAQNAEYKKIITELLQEKSKVIRHDTEI